MGAIVCAVDDSLLSRATAEAGAVLATRLRRRLVLVHAVAQPVTVHAEAWKHAVLAGAEKGAATLAAVAQAADLPNGVVLRVEFGEPAARVVAVARHEHAAVIVVGSRHGRRIRNSVSRRVLQAASCCVLFVPAAAAFRGFPRWRGERLICALPTRRCPAATATAGRVARALGLPVSETFVQSNADLVELARGAAVPVLACPRWSDGRASTAAAVPRRAAA
jgi:nucleotide-binding universal stress UspA family protein